MRRSSSRARRRRSSPSACGGTRTRSRTISSIVRSSVRDRSTCSSPRARACSSASLRRSGASGIWRTMPVCRGDWRWSGSLLAESALVAALWTLLADTAVRVLRRPSICRAISSGSCCARCRGTTSTPARLRAITGASTTRSVSTTAITSSITPILACIGPRFRARVADGARASRWPPLLRWLEAVDLETLERLVLRSAVLQRLVVRRASQRVSRAAAPTVRRSGAWRSSAAGSSRERPWCFASSCPPREIVVIDASRRNLDTARRSWSSAGRRSCTRDFRRRVDRHRGDIRPARDSARVSGRPRRDLRRPPAPAVLVHDWLWHGQRDGAASCRCCCSSESISCDGDAAPASLIVRVLPRYVLQNGGTVPRSTVYFS